jgi:hypothetical protein
MGKSTVWESTRKVLESAAAALLSALVLAVASAGGGYLIGKDQQRQQYVQTLQAAPEVYISDLGRLIEDADRPGGDLVAETRAIVSTRDDLRSSLTSLSELLNSDIDALARSLVEYEKPPRGKRDATAVQERIKVLAKKWPSKKRQIEYEIRKLLAELGVDRIDP